MLPKMEASVVSENGKSDEVKRDEPKDPYGFVTFTIFLFGIASLLPWNFFITANDYWMYKFRDVNNPNATTPLQNAFPSYLAIASKVPYILFLGVNTAISARVRTSLRIGWPLLGCIIFFIITTILVKIDTDHHQYAFLTATLIIVVLINVVCGFLQGGGSGLAGCFPTKYMAINVLGQAVGGVFATTCQLLTLLCDFSPLDSALLYFSLATITLIITQICFGILVKMDFYNYYTSLKEIRYDNFNDSGRPSRQKTPFLQIFLAGWPFYLSVVLIFWVTLAVFPAVTVKVVSSHADNGTQLTNKYFLPLACFLLFNVADLLGRITAKYIPIPSKYGKAVLLISVSRVVFIPLFLMCNIEDRHLMGTVFSQDWQYIIIMAAFGLSNGYITTLAMTYSSKASSAEHQETAGSLAAVFLGLGLMLGSVSSYGTIHLI